MAGGHSEPALRRAARLADGWLSVNTTTDELRVTIERLAELRAEYGRAADPSVAQARVQSVRRFAAEAGLTAA